MESDETRNKILIVDDVPQNLQVLGSILRKEPYQIAFATSGKEALGMIDKSDYALILLDIMMPEMNGFEVCDKIQKNSTTKDIPIIFLTAKADVDSIVNGFECGGKDYITKPFNSKELLARVKTQLELKDKSEQLKNMNEILEKKVKERTVKLEEANDRLSRLEKAKNNFLHLISHELRTPLNGILGFTTILKRSLASTDKEKHVDMLSQSADRLIKFSEAALLVTNLRADNYKLMVKSMPIKSIFKQAKEEVLRKAEAKNIRIEEDLNQESIAVDLELIHICFKHLLENAIKFTPENKKVEVKSNLGNNYLSVTITDSGSGFSEEALKQSFELFSSDDIGHHSEGFGLGLATVKLIMDAHNGKVEVYNNANNGATVKLKFPVNVD